MWQQICGEGTAGNSAFRIGAPSSEAYNWWLVEFGTNVRVVTVFSSGLHEQRVEPHAIASRSRVGSVRDFASVCVWGGWNRAICSIIISHNFTTLRTVLEQIRFWLTIRWSWKVAIMYTWSRTWGVKFVIQKWIIFRVCYIWNFWMNMMILRISSVLTGEGWHYHISIEKFFFMKLVE